MKEKFVDKMGREIEFIIGDDEIIATYNDEVIANFSYDITEAYSELYSMNVKGKYQYSGIGSKIIELGKENFPNVVYPKNTWDKNFSTNSDLFNTLKNNNIDTTYENIDDFMNDIMKKNR